MQCNITYFDDPWPDDAEDALKHREFCNLILKGLEAKNFPVGHTANLTLDLVTAILLEADPDGDKDDGYSLEWETFQRAEAEADKFTLDVDGIALVHSSWEAAFMEEFRRQYTEQAPPYDNPGQLGNWITTNLDERPPGELLPALGYLQESGRDW